jgi:hypothetical protein
VNQGRLGANQGRLGGYSRGGHAFCMN